MILTLVVLTSRISSFQAAVAYLISEDIPISVFYGISSSTHWFRCLDFILSTFLKCLVFGCVLIFVFDQVCLQILQCLYLVIMGGRVMACYWEGYIKLNLDMRIPIHLLSVKHYSTFWITCLRVLQIPLRPTSLLGNGRARGSTSLAVPNAHYPEDCCRIFSCPPCPITTLY